MAWWLAKLFPDMAVFAVNLAFLVLVGFLAVKLGAWVVRSLFQGGQRGDR